jgi:hypothetical protein
MVKRLFVIAKNKPTGGGFVDDLFEVLGHLTVRNKASLSNP